jgi:signal transduction histidine kinase
MQSTAETIVVVLGAVFAAATLVSIRLARGLAEPVQRMRNFAVDLGEGQLGERLDIRRQDELGELGTELNRMSRRLAAVDEERRAFLASASHELRTPVSNIHVTLEALESGAGEDPDLRRRFVQSALGETSRMIRMIQDLLDLGRLEAGVSVIERQRTTVQHLVDRLHRAMEPRLQDARVHVEVDVVDAPISIDTERMLQALMNILDNALKFAPPRSTVRIRTRVENACAVLSIEDEGPGIAPADLPRVFEQFWMADPARKRSGTGLGLAIARRIVESHGGTISAGSAGGRGATFTVSLPTRGEDGAIG